MRAVQWVSVLFYTLCRIRHFPKALYQLREDYGSWMENGIRHAIYLQFSASSFPCSLENKPINQPPNTHRRTQGQCVKRGKRSKSELSWRRIQIHTQSTQPLPCVIIYDKARNAAIHNTTVAKSPFSLAVFMANTRQPWEGSGITHIFSIIQHCSFTDGHTKPSHVNSSYSLRCTIKCPRFVHFGTDCPKASLCICMLCICGTSPG